MRKYTIFGLLLFFFFYTFSFAETIIEKVEINPLNRALIYLSEKPISFFGELSPSKQKITIRLDNTKVKNNINILGSTGIIKNVAVNSYKNFSEVLIELSDKRGFTVNYLPYSKSIMLEVFDWNKLNQEEDSYRLGLLSFNDGLYKEAENYFKRSASKEIPNAYFFLGLINLTKGRNTEAIEHFLLAEKYNCNIKDNFAGLAEAYRLLQDSKKSNFYKAKFQIQTGINQIDELYTTNITNIETTDENFEPSFLSNNFSLTDSFVEKDTTQKTNLIAQDSNKVSSKAEIIETPINTYNNNPNNNNLPEWLSNGILYLALVLGLFVTLILSLYKKWKTEQLLQQKKVNDQKFKEKLEQARKNVANSKQMANIYQKYEKTQKQEQNTDENIKINSNEAEINKKQTEKINEIELLAKTIVSEKIKKQINTEESKSDEKKATNIPLSKKLNPNLELALHLQNQNLQQKNKKLNEIDFEEDYDSDKLSEFAKKTGIDTGSLKVKKIISQLLNDDEAKNVLSKKFIQAVE
ncbi:MAG: hypothetical protein N2319_10805 [Candidatus Kapabacteria bacterium]|nr:hypothetical protein [Candidatus Kapabacteria bacterium]